MASMAVSSSASTKKSQLHFKVPAKSEPRTLRWNTRVLMAQRGVRSVAELCRQLQPLGVDISESQLSRIIDGKSSHFNAEVVAALVTALDCQLSDLIAVR